MSSLEKDINAIHLDNMSPWEKIEFVLRRHWIMYIFLGVRILFSILLTGVALLINHPIVHILIILFWMAFLIYIYIAWLNHELDLFVVTNNRIVWVEQISFLNRIVSECNLWQVQEVNSQSKWFLANILNFWLITIQTAWNTSNFEMDWAPNPMQSSRKILNIVDHYRDLEKKKYWWWWDWLWWFSKNTNNKTIAQVIQQTEENVKKI
jgi:hypothetical protein